MITTKDLIAKFQQAIDDQWGYIWGTSGEKWTALKQENLEKTTDADRALSRQYGKKWIGHMVADCSGLFTWAFKQLGGTMYHGSNTMYLKWCDQKGKLEKGKRTDFATLKPGTAVFVWNGKSYSHVGLFVGGDTVIEAQETKAGVTTSKITATKWTHWGELTGVNYVAGGDVPAPTPAPDPAPEPEKKPTLRKGNKGQYVTLLQTMLINRGYQLPRYGADGSFGAETEAAVKAFQKDWGLTQDGVAGPRTWEKLETTQERQKTFRVIFTGLNESEAKALMEKWPGGQMEKE